MQKGSPARTANHQVPAAPIGRLTQLLHHHFLLILMAAYALSATLPQFGLWLQHITLGQLRWPDGSTIKVTLPLLLLSFLLFNAGLGIKVEELAGLGRRPAPIVAGFIANIAVPILLVLCLRGLLQLWHNTDELQNLLVGLALITAMPIAGSATAVGAERQRQSHVEPGIGLPLHRAQPDHHAARATRLRLPLGWGLR